MDKTLLKYERKDGFKLVGVGSPSSVEVYFGARSYTNVALNYRAALSLLKFLIQWWIVGTLCGLRPRWINWKLERELNARIKNAAS